MNRMMWTSRTAMNAQQEKLDMISNNIANMGTTGYKKADVGFGDLVYETMNKSAIPVSNDPNRTVDPENGTGVRTMGTTRNNASGGLVATGEATDLALQGSGYFKVIRQDGSSAYVRSGNFTQDGAGRLTDNNGDRLEVIGQDTFSNGNFRVATDGTISVAGKNVGKINVYDTIGQDSLTSVGNNMYVPKAGAQMFITNSATISQGYSEGSNVDIAKEMTDMIVAQRAFQLSSKSLSTADQMASMVNDIAPK
mgnify:CR=1 FL=1